MKSFEVINDMRHSQRLTVRDKILSTYTSVQGTKSKTSNLHFSMTKKLNSS